MKSLDLIIPVYKNEENLPYLIDELKKLSQSIERFSVIFVIDGSPDSCEEILVEEKKDFPFETKIITHSRNFGPYAGVRSGLANSNADICAIMSADLQEPPELIEKFYKCLQDDLFDIAIGTRRSRNDGFFTDLTSKSFWFLYKTVVNSEMPPGGVDMFAIKANAKQVLLDLEESESSLIAQLFWIGFNRIEVPYDRRKREVGKSASNFAKRLKYMTDSVFSFTSLPINTMLTLGASFISIGAIYGLYVLYLALFKNIDQQGFATLVMLMIAGFGLNMICTGILGVYVWKTLVNSQKRPQSIIKKIIK